jgi:hypothetical protein
VAGCRAPAGGISRQGALAILFFIFGIARSWQLVGERDVSLASTVTSVIRRPAGPGRPPAPGDQERGGQPGGEPG